MIRQLLYVHTTAISSRAANVVQVVKTCAAFQEAGVPTTLVTPTSFRRCSPEQLSATFGLDQAITLRTVPSPPIPGRELVYGLLASIPFIGRAGQLQFYTRSISVARAVHALGHFVAIEMHTPLSGARPVLQARFKSLAESQRLRIVVISDALRADYESRVPSLKGRICVAHDAADVFRPSQPKATLSGDFKVGYIGHLYPGKGMEIIAALAPLCPNMTFHIVGGTAIDLERWRRKLAHCPNIIFHGHVPHVRVQSYVSAMDVVLAPYLKVVRGAGLGQTNLAQWMSPLKLFEYMSAGKPIVVSDLPVIRELISHGVTGLLCDPDCPDQWAGALGGLRDSAELRQALATRALQNFVDQYTWQKRARRILTHIGAHS